MNFWICSFSVARLSQSYLLLALFLRVWLQGTSRIWAEQRGTPVLHEAESMITQSKVGPHMLAGLLRLTTIPYLTYKRLGIKIKTFYRSDNPIVCYGHGLF